MLLQVTVPSLLLLLLLDKKVKKLNLHSPLLFLFLEVTLFGGTLVPEHLLLLLVLKLPMVFLNAVLPHGIHKHILLVLISNTSQFFYQVHLLYLELVLGELLVVLEKFP